MDPDVWMHDSGSAWEYVVIYVDDLIIAMHDPQFFNDLQAPQVGFTMKGVGQPTYHLGVDFFCNDDGTLCLGAQSIFVPTLNGCTGSHPRLSSHPSIMRTIPNLMTLHYAAPMTLLSSNLSSGLGSG